MNYLIVFLLVTANPQAASIEIERGIVYARPDGKPLKLDLYLPRNLDAGLRPAVVLIHGGAWLFGTRHQLDYYGRKLAQNGYICAAISYRMMPHYGFPACLHDSKAAVRWLRAHAGEYQVNSDKIAAIGNSAGGHLVSLLATTGTEDQLEGPENAGFSSAIQLAVVLYGVADLSYYRDPHGYIRLAGFTKLFMKKFVTKDQPGESDPYERASPAHYARRGCPPFLFVHGLRDGQVPYAQAEAFSGDLRRLGVPVRFITIPFGHAYDYFHPAIRDEVFIQILAFLNENPK